MVNSLGFAYKRILFCNFYFSVRNRTWYNIPCWNIVKSKYSIISSPIDRYKAIIRKTVLYLGRPVDSYYIRGVFSLPLSAISIDVIIK